MKKQHIAGLVLIVMLLVAAFYFGRQSSNKNSVVLKSDTQSQTADCAKQAQLVLENEQKRGGEGESFSQSNHYNSLLNKCFVELRRNIIDPKGVIFEDRVVDAYEQKTFITCLSGSTVDSSCFIPGNHTANGQALYLTKDIGETQIRNYMSN